MPETNVSKIPYAAYEPEGQAITVAQLQMQGELLARYVKYISRESIIEESLKWHILTTRVLWLNVVSPIKLLSSDCNQRLLRRLRRDMILMEIYDTKARYDITFGRNEHLVAALLNNRNEPIYKSQGFDLDEYLRAI